MKRSIKLLLVLGVLVMSVLSGCQSLSSQPSDVSIADQKSEDHFGVRYPQYLPDDDFIYD